MIQIKHPLSKKTGLLLSAITLTLPMFCWFSIFMYVVFHQPYFMDEIFSKIDGISSLITIFILVGLPLISVLLISLPYVDINIGRSNNAFEGRFKLDLNSKAIFISGLSIFLMIMALIASFRSS